MKLLVSVVHLIYIIFRFHMGTRQNLGVDGGKDRLGSRRRMATKKITLLDWQNRIHRRKKHTSALALELSVLNVGRRDPGVFWVIFCPK